MPRDPVFVRTILIAGFCLCITLSACDRGSPSPASNTGPTTYSAAAGTHPAINPEMSSSDPLAGDHSSDLDQSSSANLKPQPIYRPDDRRPIHDDRRLAEAGIHIFESKHLKLYTDIDQETARTLPDLIDQAFLAWEEYFGPLPPDRAGSIFQMSGYLIHDAALFRELGLMPEEFTFEHGAQRQNEFWMREQEFNYYRQHLLIHEATHCYMTFMPGVDAPNWYLEGMAEYFGTHRGDGENSTTFRVLPTSADEFQGFGRIKIIRADVAANRGLSIPSILSLQTKKFATPDPYAWSWALCAFLDGTPRYQERFQKLSHHTQGNQFTRQFTELFEPDQRDLTTEWNLFTANLQYGYDIPRAAIEFQSGQILNDDRPEHSIDVVANRGWQSSQVLLEQGVTYEVTASGRFILAHDEKSSKPWESEPQGISYRYFGGHPTGMLLGCIRPEAGSADENDDSMLRVVPLGRNSTFEAPIAGTLYLRLNDAWNSLHDNRGEVSVTIRRSQNSPP